VEAAKAAFSLDYLRNVLRRNSLALRLPSCTRAMSLDNAVLVCRGFFQWLHRYLKDELPDGKRAIAPLDPTYGRFPLRCRLNKDEVPFCSFSSDLLSRFLSYLEHLVARSPSAPNRQLTFKCRTGGKIESGR
jgi:hypothetical protein